MKKKTILFDIDGTLADISPRRIYLDQDKPDWKTFNAEMGNDTPNQPIVSLYQTLHISGLYDIILVTGRNEGSRKLTEQWMTWDHISFDRMIMRKNDDYRANHIVT